jgi:hypothetical protein
MWWERWIPKKYLTKSTVCLVDIVVSDSGAQYNYLIVKQSSSKLELVKSGTSLRLEEIQELSKKFSSPVLLCINGKGVIIKKATWNPGANMEIDEIVKQNLPTINANDFFIQLYAGRENTAFVSICRNEQVCAFLNEFSKLKIEIADVFIGPMVINSINEFVKKFNTISVSAYELELNDGYVSSVTNAAAQSKQEYAFDGINLSSSNMCAFAAGFAYLTGQEIYESNTDMLVKIKQEHLDKNKIKALATACVAFTFTICLINFFVFSFAFDKSNKVDSELGMYESKNVQITNLLENYQKKKSLIEQVGVLDKSRLSDYADKIAASMPDEVVLREMNFNPANEEVEADSLATFNQGKLVIKGNCNKSLVLNEWINVLKTKKFIKEINLENFIYNSEGHQPNFELKIVTE